MEKVLNCSPA